MDRQCLCHLQITEGIDSVSMMSKLKKRRLSDGTSLSLSSNQDGNLSMCIMVVPYDGLNSDIPKENTRLLQEIMPPKFQHTRGGARRRSDKADTTRHLRDENTDSEGEVQKVGTNAPSPSYQTRSAARKQAANPQSNEGNDSAADESSSSNDSPDLDKGSGNEATSNPQKDIEPIRGDIIKGKTPGFRDSLCWQVKGAEKHFQEGLTTIARVHLKRSVAEEVRIINSELPKYPNIEAKYKFYGLGWMSEAPVVRLRLFPTRGDNTLAEDRMLHKPIPEVFGPCGRIERAIETSTEPIGEATGVEVEEEMRIEEMRARFGEAFSNSAPRVERHVMRATFHL
ncbi:hypothetical protein HAX54_002893 [Datura stramonium]|uniref:Uncharacterized protein n=1 Tax=Datura stramonium TaxID=4076 RepID=A0ABS8RT82_DATST|nr:hypothetical protein [Datura stramonium]